MDGPQTDPAAAASSGPPPGSLEWLAEQDPAAPATVHAPAGELRTRAEHDAAATALAHGLHVEHGIAAGDHVAVALPPCPALVVLPYALAKLGAAPLLLDPADPAAAAELTRRAGAKLLVAPAPALAASAPDGRLTPAALEALERRHHGQGPLPSTGHPPVDTLTATGDGRLLRRVRTAERIARLAAPFGDLLRRVAVRPGSVVLLGPGAHRPEPQFWAGVGLVTGGSVVCEPRPGAEQLLATLSGHGVGAAVLDLPTLRALVALPEAVTAEADLTGLERIILDGERAPDHALVAACDDLFGDDVLHRVAATPHTGAYAHADAAALAADPEALTLLDGVTQNADGTAITSPLTADGALGGPAERGGWPPPPAWTGAPVPLT